MEGRGRRLLVHRLLQGTLDDAAGGHHELPVDDVADDLARSLDVEHLSGRRFPLEGTGNSQFHTVDGTVDASALRNLDAACLDGSLEGALDLCPIAVRDITLEDDVAADRNDPLRGRGCDLALQRFGIGCPHARNDSVP